MSVRTTDAHPSRGFKQLLGTIGMLAFGVFLLAIGIHGIRTTADRTLRCDGQSHRCEFTNESYFEREVIDFDGSHVADIDVHYPTKGSPSIAFAPEASVPSQRVFLYVNGSVGSDAKTKFAAMQEGESTADIVIEDPSRRGGLIGSVVGITFGLVCVAVAIDELRIIRRAS